MKKCIFALLSFFFLVPLVFAETLIDQEVSNGKVSVGIKTDQGYIDAFEAEIKVSDNVTIENFTWDNFLDTMAEKNMDISDDKKTIHFVVSAKASNILLASKTITLGVLEVTSEQDADYSFNLTKFSFTDLEKKTVEATRLNQSEKQYHVIAAKKEEEQPSTPSEPEPNTPGTQTPEEEPSNPSTETPEEQPSNPGVQTPEEQPSSPSENVNENESPSQKPSGSTSSSSNGGWTSSNGSSSQSGNYVEQDNTSSNEETANDEEEEDKQEEKPSSSNTNKEDKNDKDKDKENNNKVIEETKNMNQAILLYITLGGIALCIVILLIVFLVRKR